MLLFDKLNKPKTIKNTKALLSDCRSIQNVLGDYFTYRTLPDYMLDFSFHEIEKEKQNHINNQAMIVLLNVFDAINKISDASRRRIIYEKYIKRTNDKDLYIASKLNLSEREFYRILDLAILEFSELYRFGELMIFDKE